MYKHVRIVLLQENILVMESMSKEALDINPGDLFKIIIKLPLKDKGEKNEIY